MATVATRKILQLVVARPKVIAAGGIDESSVLAIPAFDSPRRVLPEDQSLKLLLLVSSASPPPIVDLPYPHRLCHLQNGSQGAVAAAKNTKGLRLPFDCRFPFVVSCIPPRSLRLAYQWIPYHLDFINTIDLENYGWILEFTPTFFETGIPLGLNIS